MRRRRTGPLSQFPSPAKKEVHLYWRSVFTVSLCLASGAVVQGAPRRTALGPGTSLVVTQLPPGTSAEKAGARASGMLRAEWGEGARLVLVRGGKLHRVLTAGFASAADPDVSLDGKSIVFAGQRRAGEAWAIYEMNVDGTGLRQVIAESDDLRQPVYLPTVHTIISDPAKGTAPRPQIGYVRFFGAAMNEAGEGRASAIYSVRTDGAAPRRITYNLSADRDPTVVRDGRILYSSWRRATLDRGVRGRTILMGINADGSDPAVFAADEGQRIKAMPSVTPERLVVFVEAEAVGWDGAGALASVSLRRNLHSHRRLTDPGDGLFLSPSPLPDGQVLAARRPADGSGTHGIVRVDPVAGKCVPIFDDPAFHEIQARLVASRPEPDGRSSALKDPDEEADLAKRGRAGHGPETTIPDGEIYGLDVYLSDLGDDLPPGTVKRLRIIEGLPLRSSHGDSPGLFSQAPRRLIGEVPVEPDGSFHAHLPAEAAVQLQILDQDGLALRTSSWIWARYKGRQGCVGCHEDPERTPSNRFVSALAKPGARLILPAERRRTVTFRSDIAPIVEARCVACHGPGRPVRLDGGLAARGAGGRFSRAYATLLSGLDPASGGPVVGSYVHPYRARTSPLIWHLLGRNTARPWDGAARTAQAQPMPAGTLSEDEVRLFVEWIDLGASWDGEAAPAAAGSSVTPEAGGAQ